MKLLKIEAFNCHSAFISFKCFFEISETFPNRPANYVPNLKPGKQGKKKFNTRLSEIK